MSYTSATEDAQAIRRALKAKGITSRQVSVKSDTFSMGSSVDVRIKVPGISAAMVREIVEPFEKIRRCEHSGEILSGGNRYMSVSFDHALIESKAAEFLPWLKAMEITGYTLLPVPGIGRLLRRKTGRVPLLTLTRWPDGAGLRRSGRGRSAGASCGRERMSPMNQAKVFSWSVDEDGIARVFQVERATNGWKCAEVLAEFRADDFLFRSAINTLRHAGWSWVEPYSSLLSAPKYGAPEPFLTAPEVASVLARLADIWRGSDEAPALRSAAGHLSQALAAKSDAFDAESFWRDCRIDPETAV